MPLSEPEVDRSLRDKEIYQRYVQGSSVPELAKQYGFTVQYIRRILKRMKATQ